MKPVRCQFDSIIFIVIKGWHKLIGARSLSLSPIPGFIQKWYEVTEKAIIEHYRLTTPGEDESMKPLSLLDIQTSFLILGIGLTFSSVVFVSELLHSKCTRLALVPVQQDYYLVHEKESGINNKRLLSARQVELLN